MVNLINGQTLSAEIINDVLDKADRASDNSDLALEKSTTAETNSVNAVSAANTASANASTAVSAANTATTTADSAKSESTTALSTANTAILRATSAETAATNAATSASTAQAQVATAQTAATEAQTSASNAEIAAQAAQAAAETAVELGGSVVTVGGVKSNVNFTSDPQTQITQNKTTIDGKEPAFTTLPVSKGGTGQTTLSLARNAMGLGNTISYLPVENGGTGIATMSGHSATQRKVFASPKSTSYGAPSFVVLDNNDVGLGNVANVQQAEKWALLKTGATLLISGSSSGTNYYSLVIDKVLYPFVAIEYNILGSIRNTRIGIHSTETNTATHGISFIPTPSVGAEGSIFGCALLSTGNELRFYAPVERKLTSTGVALAYSNFYIHRIWGVKL